MLSVRKYLIQQNIAGGRLEFLLFSCIPPGNILQVSCNPADLHDIMASAFRADCIATKGTIFNCGERCHVNMHRNRAGMISRFLSPQDGQGIHPGSGGIVNGIYLLCSAGISSLDENFAAIWRCLSLHIIPIQSEWRHINIRHPDRNETFRRNNQV